MAKQTNKRFSVLGLTPQLDVGLAAAPYKAGTKTAPPAAINQAIKPAAINQASEPINVPGHASPSLGVPTPEQGGEALRPAFLRRASDAALDAPGAAAATEAAKPVLATPLTTEDLASKPPKALGSWALRQTVLPLPAKPAGFPAAATKARMTRAAARRRETDADAAWRYRFRQKWRREQLRALFDGPDSSPDEGGGSGRGSFDQPEEDDMMFGLDGVPPRQPAAPQPAAPTAASAAAVAAGAPVTAAAAAAAAAAAIAPVTAPAAVGGTAAQPLAAGWPHAQPAAPAAPTPAQAQALAPLGIAHMPQPPPQPPQQQPPQQRQAFAPQQPRPAQRTGEVLQGAVPGSTIRKVVMRGRGGGSGGFKKIAAPQQQRWVPPGWTSPARASQAA